MIKPVKKTASIEQSLDPRIVHLKSTCNNSFPASGDFCCLLITFANSLDPDQDQHYVVLIWIQTIRSKDFF